MTAQSVTSDCRLLLPSGMPAVRRALRKVLGAILPCLCAMAGFGQDPHALEGDLVLPLPDGGKMVFRPVFLNVGEGLFASWKMRIGDTAGGFRESPTDVFLGGSFIAEHDGKRDWLYYIAKYEVTREQYAAITGLGTDSAHGPWADGIANRPVTALSYLDALAFAERYTLWLYEKHPDRLPHHDGVPGFLRLPTECEWEFAARGGIAVPKAQFDATTPYGDAASDYEHFGYAGPDDIRAVGTKKANPLGLYDMLGNVSEMTASEFRLEYSQGRVGGHTVRGANVTSPPELLRSSCRFEVHPFSADRKPTKSATTGFRLVIASTVFPTVAAVEDARAAWEEYMEKTRELAVPSLLATAANSTRGQYHLREIRNRMMKLSRDFAAMPPEKAKSSLDEICGDIAGVEVLIRQLDADLARVRIDDALNAAVALARNQLLIREYQSWVNTAKDPHLAARNSESLREYKGRESSLREAYLGAIQSLSQVDAGQVNTQLDAKAMELHNTKSAREMFCRVVGRHLTEMLVKKRGDLDRWQAELLAALPPIP